MVCLDVWDGSGMAGTGHSSEWRPAPAPPPPPGGSDAIVQTAANMTLNGILQNVRTLRAFGREEALVHAWVENKFKVVH